MATYYLDSSSLIKRYVVEIGSAWVKDLSDLLPGNILLTSRLTVVETRSALARRRREASISLADHASALRTSRLIVRSNTISWSSNRQL